MVPKEGPQGGLDLTNPWGKTESTNQVEVLQKKNYQILINCNNLVVLTNFTQHSFEFMYSSIIEFVACETLSTTSNTFGSTF